MADFTAVIQRAVDGLSDKSPEMRMKVYEKAKTAVQRQLNAMNPPPSESLVARQMQKIDAAIAEIEASFASEPVVEDETPEEPEIVEPIVPSDEATGSYEKQEEKEEDAEEDTSDEPEDTSEQEQDAEAEATEDDSPEPVEQDVEDEADSKLEAEQAPEPEPEDEMPPEDEAWPPEDAEAAVADETPDDSPSETLETPVEDAAETFETEASWEQTAEPEYEDAPFPGAGTPLLEPDEAIEPDEHSEADPFLSDVAAADFSAPPVEGDSLQADEWDVPSIDDEPDYELAEEFVEPPLETPSDVDAFYDEDPVSEPASMEEPVSADDADIDLLSTTEPTYTAASSGPDIDRIVADLDERDDSEGQSGGIIRTAVLGLLAFVVVAGLGFAAWQYREEIASVFTKQATETATTDDGGDDGPVTADDNAPATADTDNADQQPEASGIEKFTQRLLPDGTEVEGEAGPAATGDAEGKSVAQQDGSSSQQATADTSITASKSVKMFLYEERLGQASPTALEGTVTWTRQLETQDVGNPQPVIQAKIEIPERKISALITFKKNLDSSLPASHIVELVFSLPDDFEGGGIENVVRISMKPDEQDQGQPLIGVPARITDYFHMIALNSLPEAEKTNLNLLKTMDWIDIPIVYGNGRRALIALEKGPEGKAVFDQVLKEWGQESSGQ